MSIISLYIYIHSDTRIFSRKLLQYIGEWLKETFDSMVNIYLCGWADEIILIA